MRSEGDESGIASGKRKERVILREAMKSWARAGCEVIFIYTKNSTRLRFDFIYTKNSARRGLDFLSRPRNWFRNMMKNECYILITLMLPSQKIFISSLKNRKSFHTMKYFSQKVFHSMEAFIYTKEFCAAEIWFYLQKSFRDIFVKNWWLICWKNFRAASAYLLRR